ncbi:MAG: AbrB/MazE/SpoVT family DNA-binding domain-containing protein [Blastocatellia bacterium]|nr:AbrB/MazE/SpoVT family DNA-binding domain-containing protein [Blastocatellia bacterium]
MSIAQSKITAQGQISIPSEIRRKLGVGPGSVLEWNEDGEKIIVTRAGRYTSEDVHMRIFSLPPESRSLPQLKEGIRQRMKKKYEKR